jgi:hypothetical protein
MQNLHFTVILFLGIFASCVQSAKTEKITIASEQRSCTGVALQECMLVKEEDDSNWTYFYTNIEGFDYEPGYEYVLEIRRQQRENPAQDQSNFRYILVKEISKIKKQSRNLPD